jgi:hypothetical protein
MSIKVRSGHEKLALLGHLAQDVTQGVTLDGRMQEWGVQINGVAGLTTILANVKHARPAQVAQGA